MPRGAGMMEIHPAAEIFPLMSEPEYRAFLEDIRANGQREPIILYRGRILHGRNRWRACRELGREVQCVDWTETDGPPENLVVSKNLHRRHLNEAQRAEIAARLATRGRGNPAFGPNAQIQALRPTQAEAAEMMNVSRSSVQAAKARLAGKNKPQLRKTTIVMKPTQAARVIFERWPRGMIEELIASR